MTTQKNVTTCHYVPSKPGQAVVTVCYGGDTCNNFPRAVQVKPKIDTNLIRVFGPGVDGDNVIVDIETEFTIDATKVTRKGGSKIDARITGPILRCGDLRVIDLPRVLVHTVHVDARTEANPGRDGGVRLGDADA